MDSAGSRNPASIREWNWSPAEKAAAHRAFNLALRREKEAVLYEAKARAAHATGVDEIWELESWLGKRRREIDRDYDFRYSVLPMVFASLLRTGRLTEEELHGLAPEKLDAIRFIAGLR
ncbi:MAG: hypothetical protein WCE75_12250 [Terracidiphilus sp.]